MIATPVAELLGIEAPILQSGFGLLASPELTVAVSESGGLGTLGLSELPPRVIIARMREVAKATRKPFAANFLVPLLRGHELDTFFEEGGRIVVLAFDDAAPHIRRAKAAGAIVLHQTGNLASACRAAEAGADIIIAQGLEAGGHQEAHMPLWPLLREVVPAVAPVPVVAAGGIVDGSGLAAALALGAGGVLMGTRFVASLESAAHPTYKQRVLGAHGTDTYLTKTVFDVGWPDMPHRVIRNHVIDEWERLGCPEPGARPGEDSITGSFSVDGSREHPVPKYGMFVPTDTTTGDIDAMALYAGQGCGQIDDLEPAGDIVRRVAAEAESIIARRLPEYLRA